MHKKPLGEDKHFPQIEQEQIKKFCAEFWAVVHLHLLQPKLILPRVHSLWNVFSQETQNFYLTRFIFLTLASWVTQNYAGIAGMP